MQLSRCPEPHGVADFREVLPRRGQPPRLCSKPMMSILALHFPQHPCPNYVYVYIYIYVHICCSGFAPSQVFQDNIILMWLKRTPGRAPRSASIGTRCLVLAEVSDKFEPFMTLRTLSSTDTLCVTGTCTHANEPSMSTLREVPDPLRLRLKHPGMFPATHQTLF